MVQKWGVGGLLIVGATALYVISLFLPWASVLFMSVNGFQQEGYLVLILFAYPIYTVLAGKPINRILGLACSVLAVIFLIYYMTSMSEDFMGTSISAAGFGLYVAVFSAIVLLVGVFLKTKEVK